MKEEFGKEKITIDRIKRDISIKKNLSAIIILAILLPIVIYCAIEVILRTSVAEFMFFEWHAVYLVLLFILSWFLTIYFAAHNYIALKKGKITIKKDRIVEVKRILGGKGKVYFKCLFSSHIKKGKTTKNISFLTSNRTKEYEGTANEMNGN